MLFLYFFCLLMMCKGHTCETDKVVKLANCFASSSSHSIIQYLSCTVAVQICIYVYIAHVVSLLTFKLSTTILLRSHGDDNKSTKMILGDDSRGEVNRHLHSNQRVTLDE